MSFFLCAVLLFVNAKNAFSKVKKDYDVCIVGGGAGGTSTGVFAKDKGKSVVLIERASNLGGHCDTLDVSPPYPGVPNWIDLGVQIIVNTIGANIALDGTATGRWPIDTKAYIERFAGVGSAISGQIPYMNRYLSTGVGPLPESTPNLAFAIAYKNLKDIVTVRYPWIDRYNFKGTGQFPPELLIPFSEFIVNENLQPIIPILDNLIFVGGLGSYDKLTTYYALRNLGPSILRFIDGSSDAVFSIRGGCQSMYQGIETYIGLNNIYYGASDLKVNRPPGSSQGNNKVKISGNSNTGEFEFTCSKFVVGIPPTKEKLDFIGLDTRELSVFESVKTRSYFNGHVQMTGPAVTLSTQQFKPYSIRNINMTSSPSSPYYHPISPAWLQTYRTLPYAPNAIYGYSDDSSTTATQFQIITAYQLTTISPNIITSFNDLSISKHEFQPYPSNEALSATQGFYTRVDALQSYRNTYYVGAGVSYAVHHIILSDTYELVQKYFN